MQVVTPADREAALALREALADISGFWYRLDDDGPLCQAIARHRVQTEQRLLRQAFPEAQAVPLLPDPAKPSEPPIARLLLPAIVKTAPISGINCG
ncbi:hypothetical protein [Novosphingobium sp. JCM 18896]|uniref:hypothetical protein n=1 Tax=Novosphingobium sp. JCM 18896 TaxID=2989731 RepID=UPI002222B904|nr:hypothetical protein [Novosphingobium sp. JCM 18896]MCW1429699.1 hypothetical protein [Novosphingobium sp. JCM 18896]